MGASKLARQRMSVLELAAELGNAAEACRQRGMDRTSFDHDRLPPCPVLQPPLPKRRPPHTTLTRLQSSVTGRIKRYQQRLLKPTLENDTTGHGSVGASAMLDAGAIRIEAALGDLIAALPMRLDTPDRPYARMAEGALLYSVQHLRERRRFLHEILVQCIAFSPDGRTLATGSWDKTARLWEVGQGLIDLACARVRFLPS